MSNLAFISGIFFLLSMLITPMSVVFIIFFPLGKINKKKILHFTIAFLPLYSLFLLFNWQDFFFGGRGLFASNLMSKEISLMVKLIKSALKYIVSFSFLMFIPLFSILCIKKINLKKYKKQLYIIIAGIIIVYVIYSKFVEFSSQIILFPFISILFAILAFELFKIIKNENTKKLYIFVFIIILFLFCLFNSYIVLTKLLEQRNNARELSVLR